MFSVRNFTPPFVTEATMRRAFDSPVIVIDNFLDIDNGNYEQRDNGHILLARLIADRNDRQLVTILSGYGEMLLPNKLMRTHVPEIFKKSYEIIDLDEIRANGNPTMFYG